MGDTNGSNLNQLAPFYPYTLYIASFFGEVTCNCGVIEKNKPSKNHNFWNNQSFLYHCIRVREESLFQVKKQAISSGVRLQLFGCITSIIL